MRLAALQALPYNRRTYRTGEEFEATAADARLLLLCKRARAVGGDAGAAAEAQLPAGSSPPPDHAPTARRRYRRRDMRAEE